MASRSCINMFSIFQLISTLIISSSCCFSHPGAEFHRLEHSAKTDGSARLSVTVLVVGDWGRKGLYNQSEVAAQMGIVGEKMDVDFIISTGDNFYSDGLTGEDDPGFEDSFTNIYTAPSLQKQWYSVLGNHDYRGDALAQFSPFLIQKDKRWLCLRTYVVDAEVVDFFFMDTTPLVNKYFNHPKGHKYDWRGVLPRQDYIKNQLKELDSALKESNGKWKVVVGHHTLQSAGYHGIIPEFFDSLQPLLQENNVDLYVNGHDHCLGHISSHDSGLQYLTSGGGSKAWRNMIHQWDPKTLKFYYDGQGFMSMHFTISEIDIQFHDIFGNVLHHWTASKPLDFI